MKALVSIIVLILLITGAWYLVQYIQSHAPGDEVAGTLIASAGYACTGDKSITAAYYDGSAAPAISADLPPTPGGSVRLTLSDGRSFTLPQTISASGVRYANADESFVFWNKGNTASVTETGKSLYSCIEVAADPGALPRVYENGSEGFSVRYPEGYVVDETHAYQALGPGKDISGVKFTINPAIAAGTNLSVDSYLSVEQILQAESCTANVFAGEGAASSTMLTDGDMTYSVATSSDAAVGNRYEEWVYAIPGTNPCIAVRYLLHYGAIQNYPEGEVQEFNRTSLLVQFDSIRKTLIIGQ
jgi:membrane-bound inhibitor of C-type lysozyme